MLRSWENRTHLLKAQVCPGSTRTLALDCANAAVLATVSVAAAIQASSLMKIHLAHLKTSKWLCCAHWQDNSRNCEREGWRTDDQVRKEIGLRKCWDTPSCAPIVGHEFQDQENPNDLINHVSLKHAETRQSVLGILLGLIPKSECDLPWWSDKRDVGSEGFLHDPARILDLKNVGPTKVER